MFIVIQSKTNYKIIWYFSLTILYYKYYEIWEKRCSTYVLSVMMLFNYQVIIGSIATIAWVIWYIRSGNYGKL